MPISLPRECQYRIWTCFDTSADQAREMYTQKWKSRVGHRIDEIPDQILAAWNQGVIFTPERNDPRGVSGTSLSADAVTLQSRTINDEVALIFAVGGPDSPGAGFPELGYFGREANLPAVAFDQPYHCFCNRRKIDNSFMGYAKSGQTRSMRLELVNLLGPEHLQPLEPIGRPTLPERM